MKAASSVRRSPERFPTAQLVVGITRAAARGAVVLTAAALAACAASSPGGLSRGGDGVVGVSAGPVTPRNAQSRPAADESPEARATRLHRQAIIVDGHNDIPTVMLGSGYELGTRSTFTHTDLARLKTSGMTGEFFSIYVRGDLAEKPTAAGGGPLRRAIDLIDVVYRQIERNPGDLVLATSSADVRKAKQDGKIAVLMGIEGGHAIENSLFALRVLYRLGCRYMTLTHTNTNDWADSAGFSGPPPVRHHGLTPFGEEVVREMQRIGMLVDVSHASDETFAAVMRVARAPVIASHSSARALADHRRNLSDDMLRALAKNGGVAMVNFWSLFLSSEFQEAARAWNDQHGEARADLRKHHGDDSLAFREAVAKLRAQGEPLPKVPLSVLIDHIDHMVKIAGIDHVGLGSDFDGVEDLPDGIEGIDSLPRITLELVRRGYKDEDVLKILGGNFLRAFERAEAYARATSTSVSGHGNTVRIPQ